jgi:hypothetical protein
VNAFGVKYEDHHFPPCLNKDGGEFGFSFSNSVLLTDVPDDVYPCSLVLRSFKRTAILKVWNFVGTIL